MRVQYSWRTWGNPHNWLNAGITILLGLVGIYLTIRPANYPDAEPRKPAALPSSHEPKSTNTPVPPPIPNNNPPIEKPRSPQPYTGKPPEPATPPQPTQKPRPPPSYTGKPPKVAISQPKIPNIPQPKIPKIQLSIRPETADIDSDIISAKIKQAVDKSSYLRDKNIKVKIVLSPTKRQPSNINVQFPTKKVSSDILISVFDRNGNELNPIIGKGESKIALSEEAYTDDELNKQAISSAIHNVFQKVEH